MEVPPRPAVSDRFSLASLYVASSVGGTLSSALNSEVAGDPFESMGAPPAWS